MSAASNAENASHAAMFSTRLFMPGWWVRAFEVAHTYLQEPHHHAIDVAWQMRMLPALDVAELNALAAILGELQEQLLRLGDVNLRIDPSHFEKHASTTNRHRLYAFAKVLQWLPAVRLLQGAEQRIEATSLFGGEKWLRTDDQLTLEVQLNELGAELLLGYSCSHLELLRRAAQKPLAIGLLGPHAPLSFWRSAWMELQGIEQALLMRLEKAMQWENRWLHFDGIFGKNLGELVEGLDIRLPKKQAELRPTKLAQTQWLLERVGKKLYHQGLLRLEMDDEYLAVSENEDRGTMLVWQVTMQKAVMEDSEHYQERCLRYLLKERLGRKMHELVRVLLPMDASEDDQQALATIGRQLLTDLGESICEPLAQDNTAVPVLAVPTFLEWRARQKKGHPLPLPDVLRESEPARLAMGAPEDMVTHCRQFAGVIRSSLDWQECFRTMPLTTLSREAAWADAQVANFISRKAEEPRTKRKPVVQSESVAVAKAPPPPPATVKAAPVAPPAEVSKQRVAPLKQSINMKRLASEELSNLKLHEPHRYSELKQSFLDSLDEARRKLFLDVQGRMPAEHFDNHLRGSLVKFMIENPSVWKSAKSSAKSASGSNHH